jgi:hypothetical protein
MPKAISNCNQFENRCPSSICNLVAKGNITSTQLSTQLQCCSFDSPINSCSPIANPSECDAPNIISQCHNISASDACQRTDCKAHQACEYSKDSLFCLSTSALSITKRPEYRGYRDATRWMVGRNNLESSQNLTDPNSLITVCDKGKGYQLCDDVSNSL